MKPKSSAIVDDKFVTTLAKCIRDTGHFLRFSARLEQRMLWLRWIRERDGVHYAYITGSEAMPLKHEIPS